MGGGGGGGGTCTICMIGREHKRTNNRTMLPALKNNAAAGYQGPAKIELLEGAGVLVSRHELGVQYDLSVLLDTDLPSGDRHERDSGPMRGALPHPPTSKTRPDQHAGNSTPYSLRLMCGFFNVP